MRIGLIGYGSIGSRHVANLIKMGIKQIVLLRSNKSGNPHHLQEMTDSKEFFKENFDLVIIANPTSMHYELLSMAMQNNMNVLVEKPIVCQSSEVKRVMMLLNGYSGAGMTAYNLRFHPCVIKIQELLKKKLIGKIYSGRFFVGQYLPDWKPDKNYRQSYSAKRKYGGGVIMDLIHEIDLAFLFFGEPKTELKAICGKISNMDIDSEDIAEIIYCSEQNVLVSIHQDYLYRGYHRDIVLIGEKGTLIADLQTPSVTMFGENGEEILRENYLDYQRNDSYLLMMKYLLACIKKKAKPIPSISNGLESVRIALAVRRQTI